MEDHRLEAIKQLLCDTLIIGGFFIIFGATVSIIPREYIIMFIKKLPIIFIGIIFIFAGAYYLEGEK